METIYRLQDLVKWNAGVGPKAGFTRAISSIVQEGVIRFCGPFDHIIEVDMKQAAALSFKDMLTIKVAETLGLLDIQEYNKLKEQDDDVRYFSYGRSNAIDSLWGLTRSVALLSEIFEKLSKKRYLLVVHNLQQPIKPIMLDAFTEDACLPPPMWKRSFWLVSTTSKDVYDRSKVSYVDSYIDSYSYQYPRDIFGGLDWEKILMLTLYSLHQAAKYILNTTRYKDETYWHIVALKCFHYAAMLLIPYCSPPHGEDGDQQNFDARAEITSDELIHRWGAQGILPVINQSCQERMEQVTDSYDQEKVNDDDIYQIGNVILQAFQEYSLLQLPFCPATKADAPTDTAAHFLVYSGLIAEHHMIDELYDDSHPGLEHMQWISHVGDQGWHIRTDWFSNRARGPATLIISHCSRKSTLFGKLDHLLAKSHYICVLDLSFTPLISLPSSICYLQNLQRLFLRGCNNLSNPLRFSNDERSTLLGNNSNKMMISLLHLDFSYSNIKTFGSDFFHYMPNLQDLILEKCSNLVELPPSISALTSLKTLELSGTQIKCFGMEIFAQKKKLRSLKLIGKILLFLPMLISEAFNLINVHIEGWHSSIEEEVKLEGHPTMRSFRLVNSPHIKRLSLCGCKNLEYVDIKELDALEELNLSATPIKELPSDIPSLPRLRQLLLVGVPSLRRFPWHEVRRLPDVFCLDQYSDGNNTNLSVPQVTQVSIIDSRFFYSFDSDSRNLVRDGKLFRYFYVRVASRKARCRKMQDEEDKSFIKKLQESMPAAYVDVNHCCLTEGLSMVPMDDVPPFQETERHVEISAVERYPHGLKHLLGVTKSISMMDDTHVSILTELFSDWGDLEECMLRRCHRMVQVFAGVPSGLKNACASHLNSLIHFSISPFFSFDALKHLRLEHCPRLEGVIPRGSGLPCLLTLDVQFCYNLKAILYDVGYAGPSSRYQLPCLRRMHLQELPLLKHLHVDDAIVTAPAWEELHVRGCWSLHRLPRLHQRPDKKAAVKVSGERAWWQNLDWEQEDGSTSLHCSSYQPVLPPASACFHEHVVITSYLR
ncbi:hypothetical protein HU200_000281 [Digitaria exilis]|uniref:Uncharacterized protein n=1 Tax=Digitaria exilis TaxID=1010633 RepID=A0A835KYM4_9POAL|nr:hypothetical protein HU200_000281 [Digitaria exilis]